MEVLTPTLQIVFYSVLGVSLIPFIYRIVKGPHIIDRIMCIDAIALIIICITAVWKIQIGTTTFFDAILLLAIVGFVSTVAFGKYLEHGDLID